MVRRRNIKCKVKSNEKLFTQVRQQTGRKTAPSVMAGGR